MSTKERGDQWKITSPALPHAHTHTRVRTHTHTHRRGDTVGSDLQLQIYLAHCWCDSLRVFLMGKSAGGHGCVVRTRRPATRTDVCRRLCTFPRNTPWEMSKRVVKRACSASVRVCVLVLLGNFDNISTKKQDSARKTRKKIHFLLPLKQ